MSTLRPTTEELAYVGFTELQIILINDAPPPVAWTAYYQQLENLMSDGDDDIDF